MNNPPVDLDFSHKYDREHAEAYLKKHQDGLARKLSHRRDVQLARHALKLAGQPNLVLDLPCGAGRFWPLLAEKDNRVIIGADNSADMLAVACAGQPDGVVKRVRPLQTSAFAIDLPDCFGGQYLLHAAAPPHRRGGRSTRPAPRVSPGHAGQRDPFPLGRWQFQGLEA